MGNFILYKYFGLHFQGNVPGLSPVEIKAMFVIKITNGILITFICNSVSANNPKISSMNLMPHITKILAGIFSFVSRKHYIIKIEYLKNSLCNHILLNLQYILISR